MIPEVRFDFSFDIVLILIFISYLVYGYLSGGHKQIRLSINLILPFMIIYYLGRQITSYLYVPLSKTVLFEFIFDHFDTFKYTTTMIIAYIITYLFIFIGIFVFSIYARRHILNENMRAKLGKKNNYLGAIVAFINGYVLIYFIILPVFAMNLVDNGDFVTTFVLEHPPPFSRIARTAEKAVPVKQLAAKAEAFQHLLTVDGVEGYYNEAIYDYQQEYVGTNDSYETGFMSDIYPELTIEARTLINDSYNDYFGETLSSSNYTGVSRVLVTEYFSGDYIYEAMIDFENDFDEIIQGHKNIVKAYDDSLDQYDADLEYYAYQLDVDSYEAELEGYIDALNLYLDEKIASVLNLTELPAAFTDIRPEFDEEMPSGFDGYDVSTAPILPIKTQEVIDSEDFVDNYTDKEDVTSKLSVLGKDFKNHLGLLMWYIDEMDRSMASDAGGSNISDAINSFKSYYPTIIANINDEELESTLYLAQMSIRSYDVFNDWLDCTLDNIDNVALDDIELPDYRCAEIDFEEDKNYDFTDNALDIVGTLFDGESVSWIIVQFKYDYEAGLFDEAFDDFPEVEEVLTSTKGLVDDYDEYYKDIASSIDGNVSMIVKIAISVMKYNLDVYGTLRDTPLLGAFVNDLSRMCNASNTLKSDFNRNVEYCQKSEGEGGIIEDLFNMQYLTAEVLFKAYIMIDDENEPIIYDTEKMEELLSSINDSVEGNVFTTEVISVWGDQFAFNVIDGTENYTLLEQMYDNGQITIDAMRILANDDYELFSDEFSQRVRSMIR